MSSDPLSDDEVARLLVNNPIVAVYFFPAVVRFQLADGRILALWDASDDYGREWKLEDTAP